MVTAITITITITASGRSTVAADKGRVRSVATRTLCLTLVAGLASGCTTLVAYKPLPTGGPQQTLKFAQGAGTLVVKDSEQELFMHPTFRFQGTTQPTFTIGFANNTTAPVNFTPDNVKAYFRGQPLAIYSYDERLAEIQNDKRGRQVGLAIAGVLLAAAAVYGATHQTYRTNYSGYSYGRHGGGGHWGGSNTTRVYDPLSGILVGSVIGGATYVGVRQIEYDAQGEERAAGAILQYNTVEPRRMVTGQLIVKDCCDRFEQPDDRIRFEVTTMGKVSVFEFARTVIAQP